MAKIREMLGEKVISGFRGMLDFYYYMGQPCVRRWPKSPGPRRAPQVEAQWPAFTQAVALWRELDPSLVTYFRQMAQGTGLTARDVFMRAYLAGIPKLFEHNPPYHPPPNPSYFAVLNILDHNLDEAHLICVRTDIPCHLWARNTAVPPVKHLRPVLRRGLQMHCDPDYCFVAYTDVEQLEPADTLIHSFVIIPWFAGITYWFYLHGQVAGQDSPSTSPEFPVTHAGFFHFTVVTEPWTS